MSLSAPFSWSCRPVAPAFPTAPPITLQIIDLTDDGKIVLHDRQLRAILDKVRVIVVERVRCAQQMCGNQLA